MHIPKLGWLTSKVIFKLDGDGNCVNIHRDRLANISGAPMHGWTNTEFRRMAVSLP
jgi:exonuclease-1